MISVQPKDANNQGHRIIIEDAEEKFVYLSLSGGEAKEISRNDLLEMIKNGRELPPLEIREK